MENAKSSELRRSQHARVCGWEKGKRKYAVEKGAVAAESWTRTSTGFGKIARTKEDHEDCEASQHLLERAEEGF